MSSLPTILRRRTKFGALLLAGAMSLGLVACGSSSSGSSSGSDAGGSSGGSATAASSSSSSGSSRDSIVIGHAGALTGFMKIYDGPVQQGMELAAQQLNAKGGVLGKKIKIISADSETSQAQERVAAEQLIGEGAQFIVPSCDYDFGAPAAQVAGQHKLIAITCAGGPLFGYVGSGPYAFNVFQGSPTEGATDADFAIQKGWKKAFLLDDTSLAYTADVCKNFAARYKQDGGQVLGEATMQNTDTTVSSQVSKIQSAAPQVVELCSYPPGGVSALRQIRSAGVTAPIIGAGAFDGTYWTNTVPGITNFYIAGVGSRGPTGLGDDPSPARDAFFKAYDKAFGTPVTSALYPLSGYEDVQTLAIAIQKAGTTDGPAVAKALESFNNEPLILGPTTYTATCHVPVGRTMLVIEYVNGKEHYVESLKPGAVPDHTC